jgi:hypothetical protein
MSAAEAELNAHADPGSRNFSIPRSSGSNNKSFAAAREL